MESLIAATRADRPLHFDLKSYCDGLVRFDTKSSRWTTQRIVILWRLPPATPPTHPTLIWQVTYVSLEEARDYCKWAGGRLPHAWEWQYAAQGTDGRSFPWGAQVCDDCWPKFNTGNVFPGPESVAAHAPAGDSPFGVSDTAGNVWQVGTAQAFCKVYAGQGTRKQGSILCVGRNERRGSYIRSRCALPGSTPTRSSMSTRARSSYVAARTTGQPGATGTFPTAATRAQDRRSRPTTSTCSLGRCMSARGRSASAAFMTPRSKPGQRCGARGENAETCAAERRGKLSTTTTTTSRQSFRARGPAL